MSNHTKPTIAAVGTAFLLGLGATSAVAADNPFAAQPLSSGYAELAEAKCGEAKCGGDTKPKADTEGKCGEAKCGAEATPKADTEGKCGEAKCGGNQ
ncbi:hypothetical protein CLV44_12250 [Marinobacterium halophilum]|uniref:Low-complexity protein n=1 Tax=Marinobacterium halophilum TaxID=267374 RepID=A0A2P8EQS6_9GAMM|nr:hypothetical protein [Marinobacterium halophilum]PSL11827.1 hypothetical protein CLV44_12250 [Marinobacterium halophilum]